MNDIVEKLDLELCLALLKLNILFNIDFGIREPPVLRKWGHSFLFSNFPIYLPTCALNPEDLDFLGVWSRSWSTIHMKVVGAEKEAFRLTD